MATFEKPLGEAIRGYFSIKINIPNHKERYKESVNVALS
jgi:hypothetical protein